MGITFALLLALSFPPAADDALTITDVRFTYGYLGPERTKAEFLPGEKVFVAYNVKNMKLNEQGRASFSVAMEVLSSDGDILKKQLPLNKIAQNYFGGPLLPAAASGDIPLTIKPGQYKMRVVIEDRATKAQAAFTLEPRILPAQFGIIHVEPTLDSSAKVPSTPVGVIGESLFINFAAVGYERDKSTKQPDVKTTLRILDEDGKPTMPNPLVGRANHDIPEEINILPLQYGVTLNRVGRFILELTATDELAGKMSRVTLPIRVVSPTE